MRENGVDCPIVGADPFDYPLLTENLDSSENGRIFAFSNFNVSTKNIKFRDFYVSFTQKYGYEPDQEALQVYDALLVLAKAIALADSPVPSKVAEILHSRLWFEAAGPYSFWPNGAIRGRELTVKVFNNGKFEEF